MSSDPAKHDVTLPFYIVDQPGGRRRSPRGFVSPVLASEVMPATPPRFSCRLHCSTDDRGAGARLYALVQHVHGPEV